MGNVKLRDSLYPQNVSENLEKETYKVSADQVMMFLESIIEGTSDFLRHVKSKKRTAVVFKDLKGNFLCAAVLEYTVNEEEDGQDNYNYFWTCDEKDINEDTHVYDLQSLQIQTMIVTRVKEHSYVMPPEFIVYLVGKVLSGLVDLTNSLVGEVTEANPISIEHDGYFKITIAIEDGEVCKSFIPDGPIKTLIKNDASTM